MLFWADMVQEHPELFAELPADAGLAFYVCPSTGTLNAIEGRTDSAIANLTAAAEQGFACGARGYLTTEWGDHDHWRQLPVAYLGFAFGAAAG